MRFSAHRVLPFFKNLIKNIWNLQEQFAPAYFPFPNELGKGTGDGSKNETVTKNVRDKLSDFPIKNLILTVIPSPDFSEGEICR